jgi:hypothetical protein
VIELAIGPLDRVMALFAGGREPSMRHRTFRVLVVSLVARNTRRVGDVVIVVDVAVRALSWRNRMRSGQGKSGFGVVKLSWLPGPRRVTEFAVLGKAARHMVGILCSHIIFLMAGVTRRTRQVVIVVNVTIGADARRVGVRTC